MLLIDYILLGALGVLVFSWWRIGDPRRSQIIVLAGTIGLVAGIWGVADDRWQAAFGGLLAGIALTAVAIGRVRKRRAIRVPWISGTLLSLMLVAAVLALLWFPAGDLPAPSGPHPVGVRDFELIDEDRPGVLAARDDEPRQLLVRVWYPAETVRGLKPRRYFTDIEAGTTATGGGTLVGAPFFFTYLKHAATNSFEDAPLLKDAEDLPVVIYSHGYTSFAGQNTGLMEELASHGYIVYSVQHTYDSSPTVFPDGRIAPMDPALLAAMQAEVQVEPSEEITNGFVGETYALRHAGLLAARQKAIEDGQRIATVSAEIWIDDRRFVHDALEGGDVPVEIVSIAAAGNLQETGQMGMSFGGSAAGGLCMEDKRCSAGVNLDGGDYHYSPFNANIPVPFMMFYSDYRKIFEQMGGEAPAVAHGFNDFSYERHEFAGLRDDVVRLTVQDVSHIGVSDFTLFMRDPVKGMMLGEIDADAMIRIQNDFVRGFFDTHLKGLDADFPEAQFARHQKWVRRDEVSGVREWWLSGHPEDQAVRVVFETSRGEVEFALYPQRAPISVANFLRYIDGGHYDGASFYRAVFKTDHDSIGVLQGGLLEGTMAGNGDDYAAPDRILPPIEHETTLRTGLSNERGTIAYARLEPGSAGSEIFVNMSDNAVLDTGSATDKRDGHGYATFGRVLRGMRVLEAIQRLPKGGATEIELVRGQILTEPVLIHRAYRVDSD